MKHIIFLITLFMFTVNVHGADTFPANLQCGDSEEKGSYAVSFSGINRNGHTDMSLLTPSQQPGERTPKTVACTPTSGIDVDVDGVLFTCTVATSGLSTFEVNLSQVGTEGEIEAKVKSLSGTLVIGDPTFLDCGY